MTTLLIVATVVSLALAAAMSLIVWRVVREERRRSDARVAALAAAVHQAEPDDWGPPVEEFPLDESAQREHPPRIVEHASLPSRALPIAAAVAIGVLVVGVVLWALPVARDQDKTAVPEPAASATNAVMPARGPVIGLSTLTHERVGDGLTVRGTVRIDAPANFTAVVFAFDRDGALLTSAKAPVEVSASPGDRGSFVVSLPEASAVSRYRVSFRSGDQVIDHVDERS